METKKQGQGLWVQSTAITPQQHTDAACSASQKQVRGVLMHQCGKVNPKAVIGNVLVQHCHCQMSKNTIRPASMHA